MVISFFFQPVFQGMGIFTWREVQFRLPVLVAISFQNRIFQNIYVWMFLQFSHQFFQGIIHNRIIAIHKGDVISLCSFYTPVAGIAQSSVFFVNNEDILISCSIFIAEAGALVGRSIVNENQLVVGE